eukprot:190718_1
MISPFCFLLTIYTISFRTGKSEKINVFNAGENGYFCIKIPDLLLTFNNTLIAFGEGRRNSCSDYAWTDLIYKRSDDYGKTWSPLKILATNSTINDINVIGNAAPIQCNITKRILIPYCRNNKQVFLIYSDNDGISWSQPIGPITNLVKNNWIFIGLGPPAALQLSNNRIIVPCYHSVINEFEIPISKGHIIYSDDYGLTWNLSDGIFGTLEHEPSESQAIELNNGSLLINSRGTVGKRIGTISNDYGNTFEDSFFFNDLVDQVEGCEGSMIMHNMSGYLYYSGITPEINDSKVLRYNMTIYKSNNEGYSWNVIDTIDYWSSAYSALISIDSLSNDTYDVIGILYENAKVIRPIFVPDHITFEILTFPH